MTWPNVGELGVVAALVDGWGDGTLRSDGLTDGDAAGVAGENVAPLVVGDAPTKWSFAGRYALPSPPFPSDGACCASGSFEPPVAGGITGTLLGAAGVLVPNGTDAGIWGAVCGTVW